MIFLLFAPFFFNCFACLSSVDSSALFLLYLSLLDSNISLYRCGDGSLGGPNQRGDNYECRNMKLLLKQQQRVMLPMTVLCLINSLIWFLAILYSRSVGIENSFTMGAWILISIVNYK